MVEGEAYGLILPVATGEERIFRTEAMDAVIKLLYQNPDAEYTVTQLQSITGKEEPAIESALRRLNLYGILERREGDKKRFFSFDEDYIEKPENPIQLIPDEEYHQPLEDFLNLIVSDQEENLVGIIVSHTGLEGIDEGDFPVFVIVEDDLISSRRAIQDVRRRVEQEWSEDRELPVTVESLESAVQYGDQLQTILNEGITIHRSDKLESLRRRINDDSWKWPGWTTP